MLGTTPEEETEEMLEPRSPNTVNNDYKKEKKDSFFGDLIRFSLLSIVIVIPIRLFIVSPFVVNGSSMEPTRPASSAISLNDWSSSARSADPPRSAVDLVPLHRSHVSGLERPARGS